MTWDPDLPSNCFAAPGRAQEDRNAMLLQKRREDGMNPKLRAVPSPG
ncbi:MAG: hypothetical protein K9N10_07930 [Deltaproteobacteria bacterium]|nr:hypothetical protein [Deltaproteobacteria bacterium]